MTRRLQLGLTCMLLLVSGLPAQSPGAPRATVEVVDRARASGAEPSVDELKPTPRLVAERAAVLEPSLDAPASRRLYLHVTCALLL